MEVVGSAGDPPDGSVARNRGRRRTIDEPLPCDGLGQTHRNGGKLHFKRHDLGGRPGGLRPVAVVSSACAFPGLVDICPSA